jgi:hypothetical protein
VSVEIMSRRISFIERTWQEAEVGTRKGYVDELGVISSGLGRITGAEAERAEWLTRRADRVVRKMQEIDVARGSAGQRPAR